MLANVCFTLLLLLSVRFACSPRSALSSSRYDERRSITFNLAWTSDMKVRVCESADVPRPSPQQLIT